MHKTRSKGGILSRFTAGELPLWWEIRGTLNEKSVSLMLTNQAPASQSKCPGSSVRLATLSGCRAEVGLASAAWWPQFFSCSRPAPPRVLTPLRSSGSQRGRGKVSSPSSVGSAVCCLAWVQGCCALANGLFFSADAVFLAHAELACWWHGLWYVIALCVFRRDITSPRVCACSPVTSP